MKCQNCGENEANVRYTQIINGVKKEMALCDECSKSLGLQSLDFNIPISFSSFLGQFLEEDNNILDSIVSQNELKCDKCDMTYNEFMKNGKFGCDNCYTAFANQVNMILKNLQGNDKHIGRKYNLIESTSEEKVENKQNLVSKENDNKTDKLKKDLKKAIEEERYEEAAKIRDEIKKIED